MGRNPPGKQDAGVHEAQKPHTLPGLRSTGSLAVISKGDIQPIILFRLAQKGGGEVSLHGGTDRFLTLLQSPRVE